MSCLTVTRKGLLVRRTQEDMCRYRWALAPNEERDELLPHQKLPLITCRADWDRYGRGKELCNAIARLGIFTLDTETDLETGQLSHVNVGAIQGPAVSFDVRSFEEFELPPLLREAISDAVLVGSGLVNDEKYSFFDPKRMCKGQRDTQSLFEQHLRDQPLNTWDELHGSYGLQSVAEYAWGRAAKAQGARIKKLAQKRNVCLKAGRTFKKSEVTRDLSRTFRELYNRPVGERTVRQAFYDFEDLAAALALVAIVVERGLDQSEPLARMAGMGYSQKELIQAAVMGQSWRPMKPLSRPSYGHTWEKRTTSTETATGRGVSLDQLGPRVELLQGASDDGGKGRRIVAGTMRWARQPDGTLEKEARERTAEVRTIETNNFGEICMKVSREEAPEVDVPDKVWEELAKPKSKLQDKADQGVLTNPRFPPREKTPGWLQRSRENRTDRLMKEAIDRENQMWGAFDPKEHVRALWEKEESKREKKMMDASTGTPRHFLGTTNAPSRPDREEEGPRIATKSCAAGGASRTAKRRDQSLRVAYSRGVVDATNGEADVETARAVITNSEAGRKKALEDERKRARERDEREERDEAHESKKKRTDE